MRGADNTEISSKSMIKEKIRENIGYLILNGVLVLVLGIARFGADHNGTSSARTFATFGLMDYLYVLLVVAYLFIPPVIGFGWGIYSGMSDAGRKMARRLGRLFTLVLFSGIALLGYQLAYDDWDMSLLVVGLELLGVLAGYGITSLIVMGKRGSKNEVGDEGEAGPAERR